MRSVDTLQEGMLIYMNFDRGVGVPFKSFSCEKEG